MKNTPITVPNADELNEAVRVIADLVADLPFAGADQRVRALDMVARFRAGLASVELVAD